MRKTLIILPIALVLAGAVVVVLGATGRTTPSPVSASQRFNCLDTTGTITTQGVVPDISCLTEGGSARINITTSATPLPSTSATPSNKSHVNITVNGHTTTQTTSSSDVSIEENSTQSSSSGNASSTNHSTTNITITNH
jgi:hypothetical protein